MKFECLNLSNSIKKALNDMNYIDMTSIQEKTFDIISKGKDVIVTSNTGTGKTLAYLVPLVEKIDINEHSTQILVLVPTRELAIQINNCVENLIKYNNQIGSSLIVGGKSIKDQSISLRKGKSIVIGTPGRILKLLDKKEIKLNKLKTLVLDEADEMLLMGFEREIYSINKYITSNIQRIMLSATLIKNVQNVSKYLLNNPVKIEYMQNNNIISDRLKQVAINVKDKMKNECTLRILKRCKYTNSIVFCNTKKKTLEVSKYLKENGIKLEMLNSDIMQNQREQVFKSLKNGKLDTIIVTDLLARGIDIEDLDLVINYDIPIDVYYYIHRVGRTARNGKDGQAYIFYTGRQLEKIKEIEDFTNKNFEYEDVPTLESEISDNIDIPVNDKGYYVVNLSVGKKDNIKAKDIVGALCALVGITSQSIGKIQVEEDKTCIEIPQEYIIDVIKKFENGKIKGINVKIIYDKK